MRQSRYKLLARIALPCALLLCAGSVVQAQTVSLITGETYNGTIQFNSNQIVVTSQSGTNRVDPSNLLYADFNTNGGGGKGAILPTGLMLTNGSLVRGNIVTLDDPIKLGNASIPLASVAWVVFAPIERDKITEPGSGQTGVILPTGEFFPGTFAGIKDDRVAIDSKLFGPQRFMIRGRAEIAALVLHDVQDAQGRYQVSTRSGLIYSVNEIKCDGDNIMINDPIFGNVKINKGELISIRLAKNQYQYLAGMKPDHVDAPAGVDAATAVQVVLNGDAPTQNLQSVVNAAVTYPVPKGFVNFSVSVSVPQGGPAGARFAFAVYGDGRFPALTRTPAIAAGDNAQRINVPVGNLHTITIRMEPASVGTGTTYGLWTQPIFLR